mgnify:CR=1 FL=1
MDRWLECKTYDTENNNPSAIERRASKDIALSEPREYGDPAYEQNEKLCDGRGKKP